MAAGPMAPALLSAAFDEAGYTVNEGDSGWRLEAGDEALIDALATGFAGAVRETRAGAGGEGGRLAQGLAHRRPGRPHRHTGAAAFVRAGKRACLAERDAQDRPGE